MEQMYATILVGTVNMLTTIIAIMYVDKWGRKPILYFGLTTTTLSLLTLGYLFHIGIHTVIAQYLAAADASGIAHHRRGHGVERLDGSGRRHYLGNSFR